MKHFGNCDPNEFMAQVGKFRAPFIKWLEATDAAAIRKKHINALPEDAADDERAAAHNAFLGEVQNAAMEKCPDLTREVLCIATFTDDFTAHPMTDYIRAAYEMYSNRTLFDFFTLSLTPAQKTSSMR